LFAALLQYDVDGIDLAHLYVKPLIKRRSPAELKIISAFYGVIAAFTKNAGLQIQDPMLLFQYQGYEMLVNIETSAVVHGDLPVQKHLLVNAWLEIHREELLANWHMGKDTGDYFKIEPLR
jgi:Domain of unknown function (DUF4160)